MPDKNRSTFRHDLEQFWHKHRAIILAIVAGLIIGKFILPFISR